MVQAITDETGSGLRWAHLGCEAGEVLFLRRR